MQWTAKYFDNVYLLTDEHPNLTTDLVVYVSPEDRTVVIDHESINHEVLGVGAKVLWCYEPGRKLAGRTTFVWMPIVTRVEARTIAQDLVSVQPMLSPVEETRYSLVDRYSDTGVDESFYLPTTMITYQ
jgi:hypothetical protein